MGYHSRTDDKIYLPRVKIVEASESLKKKRVNWLPKRRKIKN
ncbi:hypothetical protein H1P_1070003 [Hyella patelloides LEGE 07179]|uniref:Uncharacterized protein n=1 Tax=Hyella patelloides LEGE 07179 TaxID=945734 RepID=A0A563VJB9_9CYAN|nr:hypothetical protein H1P_1070003 [Hyella patelloides LEGE 07179]